MLSWLSMGIASLVFAATTADAKSCGGDIACACGDTVREDTVLEADLTDCQDDGLRLRGRVVLECGGFEISGRGKGEGVLLDQTEGAVVRGCRINGFKTGVRIRGGRHNVVVDNEVVDSGRYGVEIAKASPGNLIASNLVSGSGDEGVHVGTGAHRTRVVGNEVRGSRRENLYVLSSDGGVFRANLFAESGNAAIYVKHSSEGLFVANEVVGHVVHVRGHSMANRFEDNALKGGRFVFEAYKDKHSASVRGWTRPSGNRVEGGSVLDTKACFEFKGSSDNRADGVGSNGCKARRQHKKGGRKALRNSVSLVAYDG